MTIHPPEGVFAPDPRMARCRACPRGCNVDRLAGERGFCGTGPGLAVAAVCRHSGEEPVLGGTGGVCNVFFAGCNLQCRFCQNHQISRGGDRTPELLKPTEVVTAITRILDNGCDTLGLVSPSHTPWAAGVLVAVLRASGRRPTVIYNSNGYDDPGVIKELADRVDIFLPDLKYAATETAERFSGASDYPEAAFTALETMIRLKGTALMVDSRGVARQGIVVRHLVLPGLVDESILLLRRVAERLGTVVHLSLMAQYRPPPELDCPPPLQRRVTAREYDRVVEAAMDLGFRNGWIQDPASVDSHVPDFRLKEPFSG